MVVNSGSQIDSYAVLYRERVRQTRSLILVVNVCVFDELLDIVDNLKTLNYLVLHCIATAESGPKADWQLRTSRARGTYNNVPRLCSIFALACRLSFTKTQFP